MYLNGKKMEFRKTRTRSNPYRALVLLGILLSSMFLLKAIEQKEIQSPFLPTPLPTRIPQSYALEAETHFMAGDLERAIETYKAALLIDPENTQMWSELARIQVYSSSSLTTDMEQYTRLQEALASVEKAIEINREDSTAYAVRALVYDWLANPALSGQESENYMVQAEQSAVRALQLDNQNVLALTYYAEILVDQQKWDQAAQYARQAVENDPSLMDVHRVNAYVYESLADYGQAIQEYKKAIEINPNLTFLYIRIGLNYRILKQYDIALQYFETAANINEQLGIKDPIPYLAIGRTYTQMGEFFIASRNVEKALQYNPYSPDVYGQLGIVYFRGKNYEGAIEALRCAVKGCTAEQTCAIRKCDPAVDPAITIEGMPLSSTTVVYYYTYGSALAGLHRPSDDKCTEAVQVLQQVVDGFSGDAVIMNIVQPSLAICASYGIYP